MYFSVALIFQDHMVLQRDKEIPVWGTGKEGALITVELEDVRVSTKVVGGKWIAVLPPFPALEEVTMKVTCDDKEITIKDIAIGEVWIAGGQSNMEFYLRYDEEWEEVRKSGVNTRIRFFDYPKISYTGALEKQGDSAFGIWRKATEENLDYYTAVGYYFATELEKRCKVPIGIVGCNWGGTPACAWLDESYLRDNQGKAWLDDYAAVMETLDVEDYEREYYKNPFNEKKDPFADAVNNRLLEGISKEEQQLLVKQMQDLGPNFLPAMGPKHPNRPGGLYKNMVCKIAPFAMRGVIWYQGESDDAKANIYGTVFSQLIKCWRDLWKEDFPFLFVQLAPFEQWLGNRAINYPVIRKQQEEVSKQIPNTWMASISDVGMQWDIHPKNKRPVGERLALLALGHVYGENILCDAPECETIHIEDGLIRLGCDNAEGGLFKTDDDISALTVYRNGEKENNIIIKLEENNIIVESPLIRASDRIRVEFAMTNYYKVNVYNKAGIPLKPFSIENQVT